MRKVIAPEYEDIICFVRSSVLLEMAEPSGDICLEVRGNLCESILVVLLSYDMFRWNISRDMGVRKNLCLIV